MDLAGQVALVAGGTRGAGRGICKELGAAGAIVYVTGRTTRTRRSEMNRPETIEETAEMVTANGGRGIAVPCDHTDKQQVRSLIERIDAEQNGRLDILVNDIWGGEAFVEWKPVWEHNLDHGLHLLRNAVETHIITSHFALPLMIKRKRGLVVEVTDGDEETNRYFPFQYRGSFFYDLIKKTVIQLAKTQAAELRQYNIAAVSLTPGFLRSEEVLDHFGVSEENWRDAIIQDKHFAHSESPAYIGRAVVALASDENVMRYTGQSLATWNLAKEYGFTDADGTQPDWGTYFKQKIVPQLPELMESLAKQ